MAMRYARINMKNTRNLDSLLSCKFGFRSWQQLSQSLHALPSSENSVCGIACANAHTLLKVFSRPYSSDAPADKKLEDILQHAKGNNQRKQYPRFDKGLGQKRRRPLSDLISDLKGEKVNQSAIRDNTVSLTNIMEKQGKAKHEEQFLDDMDAVAKVDPFIRVQALQKHVGLHTLIIKAENGNIHPTAQVAESETNKEQVEKTASSSESDNMIHEKQREDIIPDETEVGGLLKALMDGKMNESNVKEIMANVKPIPESMLRSRKSSAPSDRRPSRMNEDRNDRTSGKRGRMFTRRSRLFNGPRSHYLDDLFAQEKLSKDEKFVSIHEKKWRNAIANSVPKLGPSDGFEAIMLNAEKMWKFPIDNEEGLDKEEQSNFEDHIFLDEYLDMFPENGQVKRFMELVVVGLQQNPHCTVQEKVDKINWFKDYFDQFTVGDLEF